MNEDTLWEWLRDVALPKGHYNRIESHDTAPGFPDVTYQIGFNCGGTIELKYSKNKVIPFVPPPGKPGMRKTQLKWIRDELKYWGNIWVIAEAPPDIYVIHGSEAEEINGADRETLHKISAAVLDREDPEKAHLTLFDLLITWKDQ